MIHWRTAAHAKAFFKALNKACPLHIQKILTDNDREPTGEHAFDPLCQELGIEHRLTPVRSPQTNGMVERLNGRISEVLNSHHLHHSEDVASRLQHDVSLYNQ